MTAAIAVDYSALMADAVGSEHGLTPAELDGVAERVRPIVVQIERERADGVHRYRDLPDDAAMLASVQAAAKRHRPDFENLVVLGIGGSALGGIALQTALNPATYNLMPRDQRGGPRLFVLDNVDPAEFAAVMDLLGPELARTRFNVISKSGETAETAAQFLIVRRMLDERLGPAAARQAVIATTDARSGTLRSIVNEAGYDSLDVPDGVGGRFSVLSAVGLFPAAMCGIDITALLAGARGMSLRVANPELRENPAAVIAAVHYLLYQKGSRLHVMMPYAAALRDLADWYRQLWAESLGKRRALDGREV
ncbi:MAG: glucose-6-phosphate isomerase, partial [Phycisphaerae bacterium]